VVRVCYGDRFGCECVHGRYIGFPDCCVSYYNFLFFLRRR
jgi:hypothetical protein